MKHYKFGANSVARMDGVSKILCDTAHEALDLSNVDMTVPWMGGYRSAKEQRSIYNDGNSRADGYSNKSYHQSGNALDVIPYVNGAGHYDGVDKEFLHFANIMLSVFNYRKLIGEIDKDAYLHWGGFWGAKDLDGNGILEAIEDKTGWDKAHWEIRNVQQERVLVIDKT